MGFYYPPVATAIDKLIPNTGSMLVGSLAGLPTELLAGPNSDVLTMVAGSPAWAAGGAGSFFGTFTGIDVGTFVNLTLSGAGVPLPGFFNEDAVQLNINFTNGWNDSDQVSKIATHGLLMNLNKIGEGQVTGAGFDHNAPGMGDAQSMYNYFAWAGGTGASGDEGQQNTSLQCNQAAGNFTATILSVAKATINTTTTQTIAASGTSQTVNVGSTSGLLANQWVLVDPQTYDNANQEAVFVTSFTATSITGIFKRAHASGVSVIGATVLTLDNTTNFGQGRFIINLTQASYSTGTAAADPAGTTVTGVGTSWLSGLPGATSVNQGAIAFSQDDTTVPPFSSPSGFPVTNESSFSSVAGVLQKYQMVNGPVIAGSVSGTVFTNPASVVTTFTSPVTGSTSPQTVNVVGTAGLSVNQYVYVGAVGFPRVEVVQITGLTGTTLTGVFKKDHSIGNNVTGLTVTGTFSFDAAGAFHFTPNGSPNPAPVSGTLQNSNFNMKITWNSDPGPSGNTFLLYNYSYGPGPLRSWLGIASVTNDTTLHIVCRNQAANQYNGSQVTQDTYTIVPAAVLMSFSPANTVNFKVVLSANSFAWNVNDIVQCPTSSTSDATGVMLRIGAGTGCGVYRAGFTAQNVGLQPFVSAFSAEADFGGAADHAWENGFFAAGTQYGIRANNPTIAGGLFTGPTSHLLFDSGAGVYMANNGLSNQTLELALITRAGPVVPGTNQQGKLSAAPYGSINSAALATWGGAWSILCDSANNNEAYYSINNLSSQILKLIGAGSSGFNFTMFDGVHGPFTAMTIGMTNSGPLWGIFGSSAAQPTITGPRGNSVALANLLTQGATLGLWVDETSA